MAIAFVFFLLVTLPHELVGVSITALFKGVSRKDYDFTILCLGGLVLLLVIGLLYRQVRKLQSPSVSLSFLAFCIICMIISLNLLIIINIEIIHFIQYAVMAIIIFPLCKNFLATLFIVTLLGSIDEAYQFYYLSPERTNYYDFNDVILNLLGAASGLIFIRCHVGANGFLKNNRSQIHRQVWLSFLGLTALLSLAIWQKSIVQKIINALGLSLDWEHFGSVLIRKPTTGFWTEIPPKIIYHVVQPIEGMIIVTILLFIFSFLYYKAE